LTTIIDHRRETMLESPRSTSPKRCSNQIRTPDGMQILDCTWVLNLSSLVKEPRRIPKFPEPLQTPVTPASAASRRTRVSQPPVYEGRLIRVRIRKKIVGSPFRALPCGSPLRDEAVLTKSTDRSAGRC